MSNDKADKLNFHRKLNLSNDWKLKQTHWRLIFRSLTDWIELTDRHDVKDLVLSIVSTPFFN